MKILVVDDNATNRKYLRVLLLQEGHTVLEGNDGIEALGILEREQIDVVISDILMPRMDGYRLCYEIRKSPALNPILFIAYSAAYTSPMDERLALDFGVDRFLAKPALPEVIIKALHEAVVHTRESRTQKPREPDELSAMKQYSEALVRKLEETNSQLSQANAALNERAVLAEFNADVSNALNRKETLPGILQLCANAMVRRLEAALARVWTYNKNDHVLELQASAGLYTHIDGGHSRVPVGQFKIGLIASEQKPHLTNSVIGDPRVHDQEWAKREGMVAFAGYPLLVEDRLAGVMALFARKPLSPNTLAAMESVAKALAAGIERKATEEELRQGEERFRELAENIHEIFFVSGPTGTPVHYVSPAYEQITGQVCDTLYQNPHAWLENIHPDDRPRVERAVRNSPENLDEVYRLLRPDGALRWLRSRAFPVKDASGAVSRIVGIAEDITESKRGEEAQKARHREIQTLYELSQKILNTLDLQNILEELLNKAFAVGSFDVGVIRLFDPKSKSLRVVTTRGYANSSNIEHLTIGLTQQSIGINLRQAVSMRKMIVAENLSEAEGWGSFKREGVASAIILPIHTDEELLGVIQLGSRKRQRIPSVDRSLLEALASQTALAIEKARLYEQTQRNLERIRALHEIDLSITSSLDLCTLLEILLEKIELFVPLTAVSTVNLVRAETGELEPVVCRGMNAEEWRAQESKTAASWAKRVAETRAPIAVLNIQINPNNHNPEIYRGSGLSSYLGVPLIADGKVAGVLGLYSKEKHEFGDEEMEFLETLAGQAAIAIQNAQLYESTKRQQAELAEQEHIQRISKELSQDITTMGAHDLLEKLTATIRDVFKVDVADVRFLGKQRWQKVLISSEGRVEWLPDGGEFGQGANLWVATHRRPLAIRDYTERKEFTPGRVAKEFNIHGFLAAPLISKGGDVIGVIRALSKSPRDFTAREIDLFEQLAYGAAIAIENEQLFAKLQKSEKVKSEFLGVMSHELRTPLNIIMGYATVAKDDPVATKNEEHRRMLEKIETRAEDLLHMINSIMEVTQIEAGAITVTKQLVEVGALFEQLQAGYDFPREKDLDLIWRASDPLPCLSTDYDKLKHILQDLLDNAIKFTDSGTITISAQLAQGIAPTAKHAASDSQLAAPGDQASMEFKVADSGIGIAEADLPFIFDMFKQIDSSTTRSHDGAGLGLYIVKKYCELLGGSVDVQSQLGKGSTFTVRLPIQPSG